MSKWNYLLVDDDQDEYDSSKNFEKIKRAEHSEDDRVIQHKKKIKRIPRPDKKD